MGARADALQAELAAFKSQVREEAIRVASEQGWCDSGLNRTLGRLGLPEKQQPRRVTVPIMVTSPVSVRVEIEGVASDAEALERIRREPELALSVARRMYGGHNSTIDLAPLPEPAAPREPGVAPAVGDPKPEYGEWHSPSADGRQCGQHDENGNWCTRDRNHTSPHVASDSRRVLAVWDGEGSRNDDDDFDYNDTDD